MDVVLLSGPCIKLFKMIQYAISIDSPFIGIDHLHKLLLQILNQFVHIRLFMRVMLHHQFTKRNEVEQNLKDRVHVTDISTILQSSEFSIYANLFMKYQMQQKFLL